MSIQIHCDNPQCKKFTDHETPDSGWIKAESIGQFIAFNAYWERERYYCSFLCEHAHTYIISHADAGK